MKRKIFAIFVLIMALALPAFFALRPFLLQKSTKVETGNTKVSVSVNSSVNSSSTITTSTVYFPVSKPIDRETNRTYGNYITPADSEKLACGQPFTGYHTGDDFETFSDEAYSAVPVYAAFPGKIVAQQAVNGYGGLIVISSTINQQAITSYYGHIDLTSVKYKNGDTVKAGSILANLGQACSSQTGGERKHLHFAIHKGTAVNVKGYVTTTTELADWLNPTVLLNYLKAKTAS